MKAVEKHMKNFRKINVLVNNSTTQEVCEDLKDIDTNFVDETFQTNVLAMFAMTK